MQFTVKRDVDGSVSVEGWEAIPCCLSSTPGVNDYRPEPYARGQRGMKGRCPSSSAASPARTLSDYSDYHKDEASETSSSLNKMRHNSNRINRAGAPRGSNFQAEVFSIHSVISLLNSSCSSASGSGEAKVILTLECTYGSPRHGIRRVKHLDAL